MTHRKVREVTNIEIRARDEDIKKVYFFLNGNPEYTLPDIKSVIQKIFNLTRPQITHALIRIGVKKSRNTHTLYTKAQNPENYVCPVCKQEKPKSEFSKKGKARDGVTERVYPYCKSCARVYQKPFTIKRLYNLSMEQYNTLGDTCMICGRVPKETSKQKNIPVDHDHKTGLIRGRLCQRCNRGLAWFQDNIQLFQNCIDYLLDPPAPKILGEFVYGRAGRISKKRNKQKLVSKQAIKSIIELSGISNEFII